MHQDDRLEGGAAAVGQLLQRLLPAPAALQQRAAHHARRAAEAGAEAQGHVRGRLGAAAAGQVHLEPGGRRGGGEPSQRRQEALCGFNIVLVFFFSYSLTSHVSFQQEVTRDFSQI